MALSLWSAVSAGGILWKTPRALVCLRNCAGEHADLCESSAPSTRGTGSSRTPPVHREAPKKEEGKQRKNREGEQGGAANPPKQVKVEDPKEIDKRPAEEADLEEEESEESSEAAEDEPVHEPTPKKSEELSEKEKGRAANAAKFARHGLTAPLGLRVLPVRLSTPSQDGERQGARREERPPLPPGERASSARSGERPELERRPREERDRERRGDRPREPAHPPPSRDERPRERRHRSRTPHRKKKKSGGSKGVKRRERGKAWRDERRKARPETKWHQK